MSGVSGPFVCDRIGQIDQKHTAFLFWGYDLSGQIFGVATSALFTLLLDVNIDGHSYQNVWKINNCLKKMGKFKLFKKIEKFKNLEKFEFSKKFEFSDKVK